MVYDAVLSGWVDDLRKSMIELTAFVPGGGSALTTRTIDNLHARYVALIRAGYALPRYDTPGGDSAASRMMIKLRDDSGISAPIVRAFLVSLYTLQKTGKIDPIKYDPVGTAARRDTRAKLDPSSKKILERAADSAADIGKFGSMALLGVGVAVGAVFLFLKFGGKK